MHDPYLHKAHSRLHFPDAFFTFLVFPPEEQRQEEIEPCGKVERLLRTVATSAYSYVDALLTARRAVLDLRTTLNKCG